MATASLVSQTRDQGINDQGSPVRTVEGRRADRRPVSARRSDSRQTLGRTGSGIGDGNGTGTSPEVAEILRLSQHLNNDVQAGMSRLTELTYIYELRCFASRALQPSLPVNGDWRALSRGHAVLDLFHEFRTGLDHILQRDHSDAVTQIRLAQFVEGWARRYGQVMH